MVSTSLETVRKAVENGFKRVLAAVVVPVMQIECQCQDFVHTVRALPHGETGYLLLATEGGIQVRAG